LHTYKYIKNKQINKNICKAFKAGLALISLTRQFVSLNFHPRCATNMENILFSSNERVKGATETSKSNVHIFRILDFYSSFFTVPNSYSSVFQNIREMQIATSFRPNSTQYKLSMEDSDKSTQLIGLRNLFLLEMKLRAHFKQKRILPKCQRIFFPSGCFSSSFHLSNISLKKYKHKHKHKEKSKTNTNTKNEKHKQTQTLFSIPLHILAVTRAREFLLLLFH
jgi:hypothetical protein